ATASSPSSCWPFSASASRCHSFADAEVDMTQGPIGIVAAMAAELRHLFDHARTAHERRDGIWQEHHLEISGRPVIAIRSGIGMVNAAAATEHLLARHAPAIVLNAGCAGAHRPDIMPGD